MPSFPWRKRKSRISRFVADLQSPPKHGGSLVVETGFPTSLIDLVVKNRDRLKKPSKKKKKSESSGELEISNPVLTSLLPYREYDALPPTSSPSSSSVTSTAAATATATATMISSVKEELAAVSKDLDEKKSSAGRHDCGYDDKNIVGVVNGDVRLNRCDQMDVKRVLIAFFKVFLVVVFGLSTKRLVVGFTMSAFLLLLLEYVGGCSYSILSPCCKARECLESLFKRVFGWRSGCLDSVKPVVIVQEDQTVLSDSCPSIRDGELESASSRVGEIQVLDLNSDGDVGGQTRLGMVVGNESGDGLRGSEVLDTRDKMNSIVDEEGCRKEILESENLKMKSIEDEEGGEKEILDSENPKPCKKEKLKSKIIKRIVPKKLRPSKKGKKDNGPEMGNESVALLGEDPSASCERDDMRQIDNELQKNVGFTGVAKLQLEKQDNYGVEYSGGVSELEPAKLSRGGLNPEIVDNGGRGGNGRLKFWVVLLIVLAGLLAGRLLPLLLTLVCIVGKIVGTSRR